MRKFIKNPYAQRIQERGCVIRVTRGEGADRVIVEERVVTPEEIATSNAKRDEFRECRRIQS